MWRYKSEILSSLAFDSWTFLLMWEKHILLVSPAVIEIESQKTILNFVQAVVVG